MKRIVITQPNYIPWKGYFDMMDLADEFVLLDAQYTHRDWRNRNLIKTPIGLQWLTIPVNGSQSKLISEVKVANSDWPKEHFNALERNYSKAPHWKYMADGLWQIYVDAQKAKRLMEINTVFLVCVFDYFQMKPNITFSRPSNFKGAERILDICKDRNATHYLTGPAAKAYLDESLFEKEGIKVEWMEYNYPEYPQLYGEFEHGVSILDLLFNVGPDMRYVRTNAHIRNG